MAEGRTDCGSSDLCTSCGLCCAGAIFDWVPVTSDEATELQGIGFPIEEETGILRFALPCGKFANGLCGIYSDRPAACRIYRCELLKKVDRGETSRKEAGRIVAEAKGMIERLRPAIEEELGFMSVRKSWTSIYERWESAAPLERGDPSKARVALGLTALNRFLDQHFRAESSRRLTEE